MLDDHSRELLAQYRAGDERAAVEIFERYVDRLTSLARSRLSRRLSRRLDAEDVVQSAYRSFFRAAKAGQIEITDDRKLWSLLAKITLRKVYRQARKQTAAKINVNLEQSLTTIDGIDLEQAARDPSPSEANEISEILCDVMAGLTPLHRQILEWYLQDLPVHEIAVKAQRATKTVTRVLDKVEGELVKRLQSLDET